MGDAYTISTNNKKNVINSLVEFVVRASKENAPLVEKEFLPRVAGWR